MQLNAQISAVVLIALSWLLLLQLSERPRQLLLPSAADLQHMLSYVHHDNFEGLAVAAEVTALRGKKKNKKKTTSPPSTTPPPF